MKNHCILSITTSGHGVGACLCINGKIVAANTLERLSRKRYDILLPISKTDLATFGWRDRNPGYYEGNLDLPFDLEKDYTEVDFSQLENFNLLIDHVLKGGGIKLEDVDCVAYSYRHNKSVERFFKQNNPNVKFIVPEHHFSHACQAYLPSPFEEAAIMVIDGQGVPLTRTNNDPLSGCLAHGRGNSIEVLREFPVADSLGGFYSYITRLCGFKTNQEGKTMGLAPYGDPEYYNILRKKLKFKTKKYSIRNLKNIFKGNFCPEEYLYNFGNNYSFMKQFPRREKDGELTDSYKKLAYAVQTLVEDVMIYLANWLYSVTGSKNLCIAGGVGLNCVANYKVLANSNFERVFIYPNAGDNGLCVGQALYVYNIMEDNPRNYVCVDDYLGRPYSQEEIRKAVDKLYNKNGFEIYEYESMEPLYEAMASLIESGKIAAWWQGRSEFGPRALGNRSILADPRHKDMKDILNSRVKFRESFRPFAPSVLAERASEFFTLSTGSPFMLLAPKLRPEKAELVPAITHIDNTARVQTVSRQTNERYFMLIKAFEKRTGIPMVLNTSFNVAGEPIVETPEDAINCFVSTGIDALGIGHFLLKKTNR